MERKRGDLILIAATALAALVWFLGGRLLSGDVSGKYLQVSVDGALYAVYPLAEDRSFEVEGVSGHHLSVSIVSGSADVTDADCPDRLCVYQKRIENTGESIVCLPGRIILEITGPESLENLDYDGISW